MSGGSYDYVFCKIEEAADTLRNTHKDPKRAAFKELLQLVAAAMYAIEWVDSGDNAPGDEHEAITKCFSFLNENPEMVIKAAAFDAIKKQLQEFFK